LYSPGCAIVPGVFTNYTVIPYKNLFHMLNGRLEKGLSASYFSQANAVGTPSFTQIDSCINLYWYLSPLKHTVEDTFSVKWTGILIPSATGNYLFGGSTRVKINGQPVPAQGIGLEKGKHYDLEAIFSIVPFWWNNAVEPSATLTWTETTHDYQHDALEAAKEADVIIFCGGISSNLEGEEMPLVIDGFSHGDRTSLDLPKIQEDLLKTLYKTGKPIVYVNFSGSALSLNWESENLPAIIQAFYPGEATGYALARVLFGESNPSGRLPVTFYRSVNDLPDFKDYNMAGRTYRYFSGSPLWGFGFGLSYTNFAYRNIGVPKKIEAGQDVPLSVDVTNTGKTPGEEVVEIYITEKDASVPVPIRALAGFKRVFLKAGETQKVELTLKPERFSLIDNNFNRVIEPGQYVISVGGQQPDDQSIQAKKVVQTQIELTGNPYIIPN
jgi:beta-glucosidase